MRFEFATAGRILFGSGTVAEIPTQARAMGQRAFVITGRSPQRFSALFAGLEEQGIAATRFEVGGEPSVELAQEAAGHARRAGCDLVIGVGGGSVIDTGKVIAALLANPGDLTDYLEVVGHGKPLSNPSLPHIAVPTTAGTGSEVTRNAVLESSAHRVKVSIRSPWMLPRLAVVDPDLTLSMPPALTASCGLDALTQVMEPFVSNQANPLTDGLCREGMARAARSLGAAFEDGSNRAAREDMAAASLLGGLALANAKLGAVHGFAGPIGGMFDAPHGMVCASLLPYVMAANVQALQQRLPESPVLDRYDEVARILTGDPSARSGKGVQWVRELCQTLAVPTLSHFGIARLHFDEIIDKSRNASSMKGNPLVLADAELESILEQAL